MAMKPYDDIVYGISESWSKSSGYSSVLRVIERKTLGSIYSVHGDFKTPNKHTYVAVKRRGYSGKREKRVDHKVVEWTVGSHPYVYNYTPYVPIGFESSALSMALGKAYDKLRGDIDSSVDLVQWRQTIKMLSVWRRLVRSIADAGVQMARSVKKVQRIERERSRVKRYSQRGRRLARQLNRSLNAMARARLEYTYGWSPTMGTLHDLCVLAITPPGPGLIVCEGSGSLQQNRNIDSYGIDADLATHNYIAISDRARVKMFYNPSVNIMTDLGKISSLNPVSILYEVIPFSFVLDWAVDIGGWLRTLETAFLHKNNFVMGFQTRICRTNIRSEMFGQSYTSRAAYVSGGYTTWGLTATVRHTRFERLRLTSAPFPKAPVKAQKFGVGRQLNALALSKATLLDADKLIAGRRR